LSDRELLSGVHRTWPSPKKLVKGGSAAYLIELWDAMPYRCALAVQYVVADPETRRCAIIDPVLDFDSKSGSTATHSSDDLLAYIAREKYELEWILDTHPTSQSISKSRQSFRNCNPNWSTCLA
jgi:hypothetical protein